MVSRREEKTSQTEKVDPKSQSLSMEEFRKVTERNVAELNKLIEQYSFPTEDQEFLKEAIPFREYDYHFFMTEILRLRRDLEQFKYDSYARVQLVFDHALKHVEEVQEKSGRIARIGVGEAILELTKKLNDRDFSSRGEHRHVQEDN